MWGRDPTRRWVGVPEAGRAFRVSIICDKEQGRPFASAQMTSLLVFDASPAPTIDMASAMEGIDAGLRIRSVSASSRQPIIAEIRASGIVSLGGIAKALNAREIRTPRGVKWQPVQVKRVLGQMA